MDFAVTQKTPHLLDEGFKLYSLLRLIKFGTDLLSHILLQYHRLWRA